MKPSRLVPGTAEFWLFYIRSEPIFQTKIKQSYAINQIAQNRPVSTKAGC